MRFQLQVVQPVARPIILTHFDQSAPYRKYRHSYGGEPGRPSLDLEKMQQKMLLKKNCGGKTRTIKIRTLTGGRPPPRYTYDPSIFAFRSLSTVPPPQPPDPVRGAPLLLRENSPPPLRHLRQIILRPSLHSRTAAFPRPLQRDQGVTVLKPTAEKKKQNKCKKKDVLFDGRTIAHSGKPSPRHFDRCSPREIHLEDNTARRNIS
ncbi:uncharacterized protein [Embiotoca jacksoni]|uniref:uncharacterized protein n=1 Tax=Embiotoca jacksoni TaxID=100190 RepID=UPI0037040CBA